MKRIIVLIVLILICFTSSAQFPLNPSSGVNNINQNWLGAYTFQRGMVAGTYADTTAANLIPYMKGVAFIMISTTTDNAIWFRNSAATKWIQLLPSGSPTGLGAWTTTLNTAIPTDISLNGYFGTTASNGIGFYTGGFQRFILAAGGLGFKSVVADTTLNKVLTYNTSTKELGYSYWYGGGSSTTPISSLTAAAGNNTISNANYTQQWQWALTSGSSALQVLDVGLAATGGEKVFEISASGAHSNNNITTYGTYITDSHSGTGSINIGLLSRAINGDENISAWFGRGKTRFGTSGTEKGILEIVGNTSGTVTIQPAAAAGTWTMTLPTTDGNSGEFLQTDGNGVTSWAAVTEGANTALSNLASVAINTSLLPGTTNSIALGSTSKIWSDVQVDYLHTGGLSATYAGYSGAILGGTANHAVLDFFDANTRIGEFYTTSTSFNFFTGTGKALNFYTNNSTSIPLLTGSGTSAQLGVNMTTPTAQLHISAGTTAAGSSPLKFIAGTNMTSPEAGAMEWDGTNLFITQTSGPTRKTIAYTSDLTGLPYIALTGTSTATGNIVADMNGFDFTINNSAANDEVFLVAANPGSVEFKLVADTKKAYLLSGAIAAGSAGDALTVVDPVTGEIGVAPNLAFNFQKENTMIYAKNGRLWAEDADKNLTQISPHNDKGEWIYKSVSKDGITTEINMIRLAELLEKVTGEKLIYKTKN